MNLRIFSVKKGDNAILSERWSLDLNGPKQLMFVKYFSLLWKTMFFKLQCKHAKCHVDTGLHKVLTSLTYLRYT